jgi:transketolase
VKVVKKSENDTVCIVACGVLVHEALKAAEKLASESKYLPEILDVHVRVVDIFSIKPVDK